MQKGLEKIRMKKWEHTLVGYLWIGECLSMLLNSRQKNYGLFETREKRNVLFIFIFGNERGIKEVLANSPRFILKQSIILKRRTKDLDFKKEAFITLPIWVKIYDIPTIYWTREGINAIASKLGKPLFADEMTFSANYLDFVRI